MSARRAIPKLASIPCTKPKSVHACKDLPTSVWTSPSPRRTSYERVLRPQPPPPPQPLGKTNNLHYHQNSNGLSLTFCTATGGAFYTYAYVVFGESDWLQRRRTASAFIRQHCSGTANTQRMQLVIFHVTVKVVLRCFHPFSGKRQQSSESFNVLNSLLFLWFFSRTWKWWRRRWRLSWWNGDTRTHSLFQLQDWGTRHICLPLARL